MKFAAALLALIAAGGPVPAQFVTIQDGRFAIAGRTLSPYWSTFYPYWDRGPNVLRGAAWADPEFPRYIDFIVELAQLAGINTLRATDWLDGAGDWRNAAVWANLDYLFAKTMEQGMFVILDLSAFRKWLIGNQLWPYDAGLWDEFIRFYGGRYHDARNLLYAPVAGEIPYPGSNDPWKATADQYIVFFTATLAALQSADPNHLHTVGGLSYLNRESYGIPWQTLFSLPGNDLCDMHLYSDGDLNITLPMLAESCGGRGMPLLVEEFGAKQESGDAARADYFRRVYAATATAAGIGFWNLGPELAPASYEVSLLTPLTFAAIRQSAPVAPAEQLVYFNDFNSPPGAVFPEWSSPGYTYPGGAGPQKITNVRSPNGAQTFLGEFGGPNVVPDGGRPNIRVEETVRLSLDHLAPHQTVTVAFDLYILKSWDGNSPQYGPDRFRLSAGAGPLIDTTFSNNPKVDTDGSLQDYPSPGSAPWTAAFSIGTLGYNSFFKESVYHLKFTFAHAADSLQLDFSSSLFEGKGTDDESWGLDNVRVSVSTATSQL